MTNAIRTATFTLTTLLCCTTALRAEITTGAIIDSLGASGYTATEINFGTSTVHAEATNGTQRIEVVYDRATGQVLSQELSGAGHGADDPANHDVGDDHGAGPNDSGSDDSSSDDHGGGSDDSGSDDHGGGSDD